MATLNEIVFSILDTIRPENMTNSDISEELVKFHIKNIRAMLIKQDVNKGHSVDSYIIQSLGCIGLVSVDKSDCCEVPTGCKVLRTEIAIPSPIEMYNRQLITRVGPVDRLDKMWQQIEYERVPFTGSNKYTKGLVKWFTMNNDGYIYILVDEHDYLASSIEYVNIQGVWEDPMDVSSFSNCNTGTTCFNPSTSKYPIKEHMIPTLIEMVLKKFVIMQAQAPVDRSNDSSTNPEVTLTK